MKERKMRQEERKKQGKRKEKEEKENMIIYPFFYDLSVLSMSKIISTENNPPILPNF